jgi:8-oxo-dGTP diphosphatase
MKPVLVAAAALVDVDGRVLIAQRPPGKSMAGLWEFPGGKIAPDEVPEAALARELKEELGVEVSPACFAPLTFASHRYEDFHLLMLLYVTRTWSGIARPLEGQALKWVKPRDLFDYPMPAADRPLISPLIERL